MEAVNRFSQSTFRSLLPPSGMVFLTPTHAPLADVSQDLSAISSFFQQEEPCDQLVRYEDCWQHDGLYFGKGALTLEELNHMVSSSRLLLESMPGKPSVFVAVTCVTRTWYLRYHVGWDAGDQHLVGEYSLTLAPSIATRFQQQVQASLLVPLKCESINDYFDRICG